MSKPKPRLEPSEDPEYKQELREAHPGHTTGQWI